MNQLVCKKCNFKIPIHSMLCPECGNSNYELEATYLKSTINIYTNPTQPKDKALKKIQFIKHNYSEQALLLSWEDKYDLGIESLDIHHKHIVVLINKIFKVMDVRAKNNLPIKDIVIQLNNYVEEHFHYEEKLFFACRYPELKTHQASHRLFTRKVEKMNHDFQLNNIDLRSTLDFLMTWFVRHIQTLDKDFVLFLEDQKNK